MMSPCTSKYHFIIIFMEVILLLNKVNCFLAPAPPNSLKASQLLQRLSARPGTHEFGARKVIFSLHHCHDSTDDDDVSQHEFMEENANRTTAKQTTGYRRIEDWHEDEVTRNPQTLLARLQQDQAQWKKRFEDLGGDGI